MKIGASLFDDFEERVNSEYEKTEAQINAEENKKLATIKELRKSDTISTKISKINTYRLSSSRRASYKQLYFIDSLIDGLSRMAVRFDKPIETQNMCEADASNMITMLLSIKDNLPNTEIREEAGWDAIIIDSASIREYLEKSDSDHAEGDIVLRKA